MYTIKQPTPSIYHFEFEKKCDLFLSFMRMQEFYECKHDRIKGKKFSLEDLIVAYSDMDRMGEFTYFDDWAAFNMPSEEVIKFIKVMGDNLLDREKIVIADMKKIMGEHSDNTPQVRNYFIGTYTKNNSDADKDTKHEFAHGLFFTQSMYRTIMQTLINSPENNGFLSDVMMALKVMGYRDSVLIDEAQAYLATGTLSELKSYGFGNLTEKKLRPFRKTFEQFNNIKKLKRKREVM